MQLTNFGINRFNMTKHILSFIFIFIALMLFSSMIQVKNTFASDAEFNERKACFENFIRCELTRTSARNYFDGKSFTISMVNFFDIKKEGDILIFTGAVECWVSEEHLKLFVAVGVKKIFEKKKVSYLIVRNKDFSILYIIVFNGFSLFKNVAEFS